MIKQELLELLQFATAKDLKELLALKKELVALEKKHEELVRQFVSVTEELGGLHTSLGTKSLARAARRRGRAQPPLSSLIAEILKEEKRPLGVNEICEALLQEKQYRTKSKNFKAHVRIVLYKNDKGLFEKARPGRFRLAAGKRG